MKQIFIMPANVFSSLNQMWAEKQQTYRENKRRRSAEDDHEDPLPSATPIKRKRSTEQTR